MLVGMEAAMGIVARKMGVDGGIVCWGREGEQTPGGVYDVVIFGVEGEVEDYGEAGGC
jgi:hypothetical protein